MMTIWDLQDKFHDATTDADREVIRQEMRELGFNGVANTIQSVSDGGVDWRTEQKTNNHGTTQDTTAKEAS